MSTTGELLNFKNYQPSIINIQFQCNDSVIVYHFRNLLSPKAIVHQAVLRSDTKASEHP